MGSQTFRWALAAAAMLLSCMACSPSTGGPTSSLPGEVVTAAPSAPQTSSGASVPGSSAPVATPTSTARPTPAASPRSTASAVATDIPAVGTSDRAEAIAASIPAQLAGVALSRTGVDGTAVLSGTVNDCSFICASEVKAIATAAGVQPAAVILGDASPDAPFETWPIALKVIHIDGGKGDLAKAWIAASVSLGGPAVADYWKQATVAGKTVWHQLHALGGVDLPAGATIYVYQSGEAIIDAYVAIQPGGPAVDDLMRAVYAAFPPG